MASIIEVTNLGISRDANGRITAIRYFTPNSVFGNTSPDHVDALIIEENGPWWLGHTVNLNVDGDEILLNCQVGKHRNDAFTRLDMEEIHDFIDEVGVVEICDQVMTLDSLEYEPRVRQVPAQYYENHMAFVMNYRYGAMKKV